MFLHLGAETVIETDNILGIFDLDTTTVQKSSREAGTLEQRNIFRINHQRNFRFWRFYFG